MIHILYTKFSKALPQHVYEAYFKAMPKPLQEKNLKYLRWQDRHAHLFGQTLLREALQKFDFDNMCLDHLRYNEYGRPYISGDLDFNLSHAGEYVLCAIGNGVRLGVDIEKIHSIDFTDFESVMTDDQWHAIKNSDNAAKSFFYILDYKRKCDKS